MIEIIKDKTNINFVSKYKITAILSFLAVAGSIFLLFTKMNYGVDFRGGAEVQIQFEKTVTENNLRVALNSAGFKSASVQSFGEAGDNEFLLKVQGDEKNLNVITEKVTKTMLTAFKNEGPTIRKVDIVGPKAGKQLRISGFEAMFWALATILAYIGLRFDFKYSPGAVFALFHDVSIILGIFALTGTEFSLQVVGALLAVIGYSVNDTVIVYDRVREHEDRNPNLPLRDHINNAINETLSRTLLTSATTLFVSGTMLIFGGEAIRPFFFALTLGVVIGTYSSIFVAAPVTLLYDSIFNKGKKKPSESAGQDTNASATP